MARLLLDSKADINAATQVLQSDLPPTPGLPSLCPLYGTAHVASLSICIRSTHSAHAGHTLPTA